MVVGLDIHPLIVVDPFCDLDKECVGLDFGCLFGGLGTGVGFLDCLDGSLEDLVVVQSLLQNF